MDPRRCNTLSQVWHFHRKNEGVIDLYKYSRVVFILTRHGKFYVINILQNYLEFIYLLTLLFLSTETINWIEFHKINNGIALDYIDFNRSIILVGFSYTNIIFTWRRTSDLEEETLENFSDFTMDFQKFEDSKKSKQAEKVSSSI